jgi:hypothetical protein
MKNILEEHIFKKIAVCKPYYALENLREDEDTLKAEVPIQQPLGMEVGPISVAEAARHLAILGSCVLAKKENPRGGRFFYLASVGTLNSVKQSINSDYKKLYGVAKGVFVSKRKAKATTTLINDEGDTLYKVDVDYYVIPEKVFQKKHEAFKNNLIKPISYNPYKELFPMYNSSINADTMSVSLGVIKHEYCVGHFSSYSALPLAVLSYYQIKAISMLLKALVGIPNVKFRVNRARLEADNFAFVGDIVNIEVKLIEQVKHEYTFECIASTEDGSRIALASFCLELDRTDIL